MSCAITLLQILRNNLQIHSFHSLSIDKEYSIFNSPQNQLELLRDIEHVSNWSLFCLTEPYAEPYHTVLEYETNLFRHGPPGCEDLLGDMFEKAGEKMIQLIIHDMPTCSEEQIEADLYVIGVMFHSIDCTSNEESLVGLNDRSS